MLNQSHYINTTSGCKWLFFATVLKNFYIKVLIFLFLIWSQNVSLNYAFYYKTLVFTNQ